MATPSTPTALRDGVRRAYDAAADDPRGAHPFPVGRAFAASVGYDADWLATAPAVSVDAFAGVSNIALRADLPPGATVLDVGCGSGLDTLIAATRVGASGRVVGIDFSPAMLERARRGVASCGLANVELHETGAERLPLADASIDVVLANGIFNLNPARAALMRELARVLRRDGVAHIAELVLVGAATPPATTDAASWFA
jgi:SAM-dependent methyltransferase